MSADEPTGGGFSLRRWSQRKLQSARAAPGRIAQSPAAPAPAPVAAGATEAGVPGVPEPAPLPPVESLTIESDYTAFMAPQVDEGLKRQALRQLFRDPRFNEIDGLDVYIGDFATPDPISADIVRELVQGRYIFDPPETRVNEQGMVEDVPPVAEAPAADAVAAQPAAPGTPSPPTQEALEPAPLASVGGPRAPVGPASAAPDKAPAGGPTEAKRS